MIKRGQNRWENKIKLMLTLNKCPTSMKFGIFANKNIQNYSPDIR